MGVKLVVFKELEPEIAVVLLHVPEGEPGRAPGWHGKCTECGKPVHFWTEAKAVIACQEHVDAH